ncbi:MAG: hypothetical protein IKE55_08390 [Kiritimatiellae bacterium]|nr:hypothetical protein [Kiritimatiellia bacterium]
MNAKYALCLAALSVSVASFAAEPWEDPAVNSANRLPSRTMSIPCETEDLAFNVLRMDKPKGESRWVIPLAGTWSFKWKSATSVAAWEKEASIAVPGCWQLQGDYDPPLYTNMRYPIAMDAPRVTKEPDDKSWTAYKYRNPVGLYTTTFKRPWRWWFRRSILHFDGVSAAFRVRLNGKEVGYAEDSRLPSEFDVTPYLKIFGSNKLEVEVYKHCDGTYLEDQDFWRLSGIFRDVYVVSESKKAPFDLFVDTKLADDMKSASFTVLDEKGNALKVRQVPDVKLWNPETPYLYMTPIENKWGWMPFATNKCWWVFGGIDYRAVTFGFRRLEIRDSVLYMNGKRVVFKGVNRHEMEPGGGYAVTVAGMSKDISLIKSYNMNAVRTCHYPDVQEWYDLCDRDGVMVVCEANVESHGYGYGKESLANRKDYEAAHVERNVRMVKTFRNHPSIILWSMGNEAGDGPNFAAAYRAIKAIDQTRPVHYERADGSDHVDVDSQMYTRPWDIEKRMKAGPKRPFMLCEYTHAMGNSNGSVGEYMDLVRRYPPFMGGFVWDFADQALWKTDSHGKWLAYGGDFGDKPNDDNFNCNGLFDALRNPHPGAYELKHAYRSIVCESFDFETGKVRIRNGYDVLTLDDFDCRWQSLNADGTPAAKGWLDLGEVGPGEVREYTLKDFRGDIVDFQFHDGRNCVAWDGFSKPFAKPADVPAATGASPLASRLRLNFWRAPTDNDRGWGMAKACKVWKDATESQKLPEGVKSELKASALEDGSVLVDWKLSVPEGLPPIPRVGLSFTAPKAAVVDWFGRGPWENYADRSDSAMLGAYKASVGLVSGLADAKTGTIQYPADRLNPDNYIEPGEQGYRTGCRRLAVGGVTVTAVSAPFGFNVWPYPQTMLEGKAHQWELSEADELTVNIDAVQMGVGGDDSWGAKPHPAFMPGAGEYRLAFIVKGL